MISARRKYSIRIACVAAIVILVVAVAASRPARAAITEGHILTSLPSVKDSDGAVFSFSDARDHYSLFVFFSIYSDTTSDLFAFLESIQKTLQGETGFQVIGVNVDPSEKAVAQYLAKSPVSFRVLLDLELALSNRFAIKEMPTLFLIDPNGVVRDAVSGFAPDKNEALRKTLEALLDLALKQTRATDAEAAYIDDTYKKRVMISAGAKFEKFCPTRKSLLLYVSSENILWTYDSYTSTRRELATDVSSADWSPDGKSVVFASHEKNGVWVRPLNGNPVNISPEGQSPAWSPGGDLIAFLTVNNEVWVYRFSTHKRWKVAVSGNHITWSPDGALLLVKDEKDRVWLISPFARASFLKNIFD